MKPRTESNLLEINFDSLVFNVNIRLSKADDLAHNLAGCNISTHEGCCLCPEAAPGH